MDQQHALARFAQFFIVRYRTTILIVAAIVIAGVWGMYHNQRQDFPSIPSNFIFVTATQPGAAAADIEQQVLLPIERVVGDLDGLNVMRSTANDTVGMLFLDMDDVEATPDAAVEVEKLVSQTKLPAGVETTVEILDVVGPSVVYALTSETRTPSEMLEYVPAVEEKLLAASTHVQRIDETPENTFEVSVELNAEELNERSLSATDVQQALSAALTTFPGGFIQTEENRSLAISVDAGIDSLDALRAVEVKGTPLSDIATVVRKPTEAEVLSLAGYVKDGAAVSSDSVYLFVYKQPDGDVITLAEDLKVVVNEINEGAMFPDDVSLVVLYDNAPYVQQQISNLLYNGWLGLVLILVVLMFFINLRTGVIVAAIIPLAFLATFAVLFAIGFTINVLTLFGLLLVLGILVDNAIVIAEGVTHAIEKGQKRGEAVLHTIRDLGPAVTSATATTVVVFIPFASIGGVVGAFLKFIPFTIIIMLLASYALAMTVTPLLSRYFMKEETREQRRNKTLKTWEKVMVFPAALRLGQRGIDRLEDGYGHFSGWIQEKAWRKVLVVVVTLALLGVSVGQFALQLDAEQFPSDDNPHMIVDIGFPAEMGFDARHGALQLVMEEVVKTDYFESYYAYDGQVFAVFKDVMYRTDERTIHDLKAETDARLAEVVIPQLDALGVDVELNVMAAGPPGSSWDVTVELRGQSLDHLGEAATNLAAVVGEWEEVLEVENSLQEKKVTSVAVQLNQEELRERGLQSSFVNVAVNGVFAQQTIGSVVVRSDGVSDDVVMRFSDDSKKSADAVRNVQVAPATRVGDVATVEERLTVQSIERLDGKRVATVQFRITEGSDPVALEQRVRDYLTQEHLDQFELKAADVSYGGFSAQINSNYDDLVLVFILAIVAVYLILVYQFNSFVQPGLILFTVPLALIAVFPALFAINSSLNMISGLGIVALVGIVVNDAIVFMDYFNRLRTTHGEWGVPQLLVETGRARFKPILSTSITTIFGILPLTLVDPFWRGLGTSLIAGLTSATIGTLIVFPVLLAWTETVFGKCRGARQRLARVVRR